MNIDFPSSSGGGGHGAALHLVVPDAGRCSAAAGVSEFLVSSPAAGPNKRKRRPAGTPDPDAEVVALSPKTLMESDRYVCEICNQGFQRDQNLQMHRRRHKVPWKLLKRPNLTTTKRVYICPERSCLHHDPAHALGDLVGIKKHYRRKHCTEKQWKCDKCSKGYAVQSDYKAHLKTCGTRGHCCDCGRVFSRVESFIEHQDTCCAVKRKTMQSGGESERIPHHATDTRNSNESPSQSSDTTQAMSFTHSGMSDIAAGSLDTNFTKVQLDEHAIRIQAESQAATPSSAMPAWLTDSLRNELELLQRSPTDHAHSSDHIVTQAGFRPARVDHQASTHDSRFQVTRSSSNSAAYPGSEVLSCHEMKMILEPSLQLSIGPASAEVASSSPVSPYTDVKPSFRNSTVPEREALVLTNYHAPKPIARVEKSSRPATVALDSLAHMVPASIGQSGTNRMMEGAGTDQTVSLSGFLTALSPMESSAGLVHQSTKSKHENKSRTEMVSYYNPNCAGSASSYHENRTGNVHESDQALGARSTRRGFPNAQLESATSSVITSRQAMHLDVAETDHLFGAKSVSNEMFFRSQNQMDAAVRATTTDQGCDQKRADMNTAWSDLTSVRRTTTDEIRQECDEAQRDLARAEMLKREAREQLQFAAEEKAYAERAREAAKRQVEISDAELMEAKRLRAHAQAELQKAGSQSFSTSFCLSCKSAIESSAPSRRSTSTSPTSWSMMAPSLSTDQLEAGTRRSCGAGQVFMNPGNRMSWSESISGFDNSGRLWPAHGYNMRSGMAIGKSPPSGGDPDLEAIQVSSPEQSDRRDQIAPRDLDLNWIS